jgi:hypothetical protein
MNGTLMFTKKKGIAMRLSVSALVYPWPFPAFSAWIEPSFMIQEICTYRETFL